MVESVSAATIFVPVRLPVLSFAAGEWSVEAAAAAVDFENRISIATVLPAASIQNSTASVESTTTRVVGGWALNRETRSSFTGPRLTAIRRFPTFGSQPGKSRIRRSGLAARLDVGTTGALRVMAIVTPSGRGRTAIFSSAAGFAEPAACGALHGLGGCLHDAETN